MLLVFIFLIVEVIARGQPVFQDDVEVLLDVIGVGAFVVLIVVALGRRRRCVVIVIVIAESSFDREVVFEVERLVEQVAQIVVAEFKIGFVEVWLVEVYLVGLGELFVIVIVVVGRVLRGIVVLIVGVEFIVVIIVYHQIRPIRVSCCGTIDTWWPGETNRLEIDRCDACSADSACGALSLQLGTPLGIQSLEWPLCRVVDECHHLGDRVVTGLFGDESMHLLAYESVRRMALG